MNLKLKHILSFLLILLFSCNKGLEPGPASYSETGFGGTITFSGAWPSSVKQTYLVLFKTALVDSTDFGASNIFFISEPIPSGITEYKYSSLENMLDPVLFGKIPPGEYAYLAVAQSENEEITLVRSAWFVAGVYYSGTDTSIPGRIYIRDNTFLDNINITVNFNSPPPQPPQKFPEGGND